MNGNFFSYVAAFGAFTSVSYETPQATKNLFGRTAYILDGAVKLGKTKSYHIKVQTDLETWEQDCILGMVTNAKSVAGLKLYKKNSVSLKAVSYTHLRSAASSSSMERSAFRITRNGAWQRTL